MTDLVMAAGTGLAPEAYDRFLRSLRDTGFTGDIVLFIDKGDLASSVEELCHEMSAHVLTFQDTPFVIHTYRFTYYETFLREHKNNYVNGKVLVADLRDVLFQKNPFDFPLPDQCGLCFAQEEKQIAHDVYNSRWIVSYFGDPIYEEIKNNPILCSGTTMGSTESMLYYFDRLNLVSRVLTEQRLPNAVYEQGVHNYLYYTGKLEEAKPHCFSNASGLYLTMGLDKKLIQDDGLIVNREGVAPCIAHQFDRMTEEQLGILAETKGYKISDILEWKRNSPS